MYIEKVFNTVCSSSLGSIQAALKKLVQNEKVVVNEYEDKGIVKKEYRITPGGVEQFLTWMQTPIKWYKAKNMEEGKFFNLGMLPQEKRLKMLKQLIEDLRKEQQSLKLIEYHIEMMKDTTVQTNVARMQEDQELVKNIMSVSGEDTLAQTVNNIAKYQCYMLEYGLKTIENDIAFFTSVYEREVAGEKR